MICSILLRSLQKHEWSRKQDKTELHLDESKLIKVRKFNPVARHASFKQKWHSFKKQKTKVYNWSNWSSRIDFPWFLMAKSWNLNFCWVGSFRRKYQIIHIDGSHYLSTLITICKMCLDLNVRVNFVLCFLNLMIQLYTSSCSICSSQKKLFFARYFYQHFTQIICFSNLNYRTIWCETKILLSMASNRLQSHAIEPNSIQSNQKIYLNASESLSHCKTVESKAMRTDPISLLFTFSLRQML